MRNQALRPAALALLLSALLPACSAPAGETPAPEAEALTWGALCREADPGSFAALPDELQTRLDGCAFRTEEVPAGEETEPPLDIDVVSDSGFLLPEGETPEGMASAAATGYLYELDENGAASMAGLTGCQLTAVQTEDGVEYTGTVSSVPGSPCLWVGVAYCDDTTGEFLSMSWTRQEEGEICTLRGTFPALPEGESCRLSALAVVLPPEGCLDSGELAVILDLGQESGR